MSTSRPSAAVRVCMMLLLAVVSGRALCQSPDRSTHPHESDRPLSDDELNRLRKIPSPLEGALEMYSHARQYKNRGAVPVLVDTIRDKSTEEKYRVNAMFLLAMLGDIWDVDAVPAANEVLVETIHSLYPDGVFPRDVTHEQWLRLRWAILSLGFVADSESLELLKEMVAADFWADRGWSPPSEPMRKAALHGLAMTGQDWAIRMFKTGEGVPEDLRGECDSLLSLAKRRKAGNFWEPKPDRSYLGVAIPIASLALLVVGASGAWIVPRRRRRRYSRTVMLSTVFLLVLGSGHAFCQSQSTEGTSARAKASLTGTELGDLRHFVFMPDAPLRYKRSYALRYWDKDVVPVLVELIQDDEISENQRATDMIILAALGDAGDADAKAAANDVFVKIIQSYYPGGVFAPTITREEWGRLHAAIVSLGYVADADSMDLLKDMVTTEFWEQKGGAPADSNSKDSSKQVMDHMRLMALQGLAMSGQDWAVHMFRTGEGVPEDLRSNSDWLLSIAERRKAGTYWDPRRPTDRRVLTLVMCSAALLAILSMAGWYWHRRNSELAGH